MSLTARGASILLYALISSAVPAVNAADSNEWHVVLHTRSWHASHPPGTRWNEHNLGVGLRAATSPEWTWQAGAYRDSLRKTSAYVLADWMPWNLGPLAVGGGIGLIGGGGYEATIKPAAGLIVRYSAGRMSAAVRVFPKPPPGGSPHVHRSALTTLEFGWRL